MSRVTTERLVVALLGLACCFVLLEGGLRLSGFGGRELQKARNRAAMRADDAIRVMCVGESTTAMGGENSYPAQLEAILAERAPDRTFRVINVGVGGADTAMLISQLPGNLATYRPHIVVVMMGFNDVIGAPADMPLWDHPLPDVGVALGDRAGFPYTLRTYRLAELLWFAVSSKEAVEIVEASPLAELPPDAATGHHWVGQPRVEGTISGPDHYFIASTRPPAIKEAWRFVLSGDTAAANDRFRAASQDETTAVRALIEWGAYREQEGRLAEAEDLFQRAADLDPTSGFARFGLARLETLRGDCDTGEALFAEAARLDPRCGHGFVTAGLCFLEQDKADRADAALSWALKYQRTLTPRLGNPREAEEYAHFYRVDGRSGMVWEQLALGEGEHPMDRQQYIVQIDLLEALGAHDQLEALASEMELTGPCDLASLRMAQYYRGRGDEVRATRFLGQARRARGTYYNPMTRDSYEQLQDLLARDGIPLIVAQYANRPVQPLVDLLDWNPDVVFVDNEAVFHEALQAHTYDELFWDHCFGDLGHGTTLGNHILAGNIATTVIEVAAP